MQLNLSKEFQQICHGLEASDEDWEKRHDGLKKIQELIKKGAGDIANFYPLFEKQIQKHLLHQVRAYFYLHQILPKNIIALYARETNRLLVE